jgi:tetratricopeptide (TPR) repeat protein
MAASSLADLERIRGNFSAARDLAKQAIAHQQAALKSSPEIPLYHEYLRDAYTVLAESLADLGEHDKAREAATEAIRALPQDWYTDFRLAAVWARCARHLEQDSKLLQAQRESLQRSYADRAMETLRQAVNRGFRKAVNDGICDVKMLEDVKDFDLIRGRDEFQALIRELHAKEPTSSFPTLAHSSLTIGTLFDTRGKGNHDSPAFSLDRPPVVIAPPARPASTGPADPPDSL